MSMAMTIVSFAMLQRCTGVEVQHIQAADLTPVRIVHGVEDRAVRGWDRVVKYYENIRLVYEVETRLRQLERDQEAAQLERSNRQPQAAKAPTAQNPPSAGQKMEKRK
jgi:hypothetical protein